MVDYDAYPPGLSLSDLRHVGETPDEVSEDDIYSYAWSEVYRDFAEQLCEYSDKITEFVCKLSAVERRKTTINDLISFMAELYIEEHEEKIIEHLKERDDYDG